MASWGVVDADSAYDAGLEYPDQSGTTAKFDDIWNFRVRIYEDWMDSLEFDCPGAWWLIQATRYTQGDGTAAYIAFMTERMLEVRRVLKPTGSVYLHCDHEANAYLRQMMDAVFGKNNFRNEIAWLRHTSLQRGSQHRPKRFGHVLDTLLFYAKSAEARLTPLQELTDEERKTKFPLIDKNGERYYDDSSHIWRTPNMGARPNLCYEWRGFWNPHPSGWRLSKKRMDEEYAKGNFVILPNGKLQRRKYERDWSGTTFSSLWNDVRPALGKERTGYPTQKPQALARRIIEASSNPGDLVLDCFAGCAYVPVAAEQTGRRWIACDMSPRAWTVVRRQFHKQPDLRIVTEGEYAESEPDEGVQPDLGDNRVIRVRGPLFLPERTTPNEQKKLGIRTLPSPTFRHRPAESAQDIWDAFVEEWGTECWYCGMEKQHSRRELQLDHVEPNRRDGSNDDCWNRALACIDCNGDKGNSLTPRQTIDLALEARRIPTPARRDEQMEAFTRRRKWARERWEKKKSIRLPI